MAYSQQPKLRETGIQLWQLTGPIRPIPVLIIEVFESNFSENAQSLFHVW